MKLSIFAAATVTFGFAGSAFAYVPPPAPAPDCNILIGSDTFANGQSDNLGPAFQQTLDNHYVVGPCNASTVPPYGYCDDLRFGLSVYPKADCSDSISPQIAPQEDGGALIQPRIKTIQTEAGVTFCANTHFRPQDTALRETQDFAFPGGTGASDAQLDQYWSRPHLNLMVIGEMPQKSDTNPDNRMHKTLVEACDNYEGTGGYLPSMPTWVMLARLADSSAKPWAQLLAAAGGTGKCCYDADGSGCDPLTDTLDVCDSSAVALSSDESDLRDDLAAGKYICSAGAETYDTGSMDFGSDDHGTLGAIRCLLVGTDNNDNCTTQQRNPTDILGIFSCIRQLPRGVNENDVNILYCPTNDPADCQKLDPNTDIEWIDQNHTLFLIKNKNTCAGVRVTNCQAGKYCQVPGAQGRCKAGLTDCSTAFETCQPIFTPMPEICNGLDDDCDGTIDNLSTSWDNFSYTLPPQYSGLACNQVDVCTCPDGATDDHAGATFSEYLANWDPVCSCGEALNTDQSTAPQSKTPTPTPAGPQMDGQAACSAAPGRPAPTGFLIALLGAVGILFRRRK